MWILKVRVQKFCSWELDEKLEQKLKETARGRNPPANTSKLINELFVRLTSIKQTN